jgi:putative FmdB family regulatory protein
MPIYEYRCGSCEHEFEELAAMNAPAPPCPKCGKKSERQLSGLNVGGVKRKVGPKAQIHDAKRSAEKAAARAKKE